MIAAAQFGRHNAKRESYGHSLIVDPWGSIVEDAGGFDGSGTTSDAVPPEPPSIITCDIDLDLVRSTRQRMPVQVHRKSAIASKISYRLVQALFCIRGEFEPHL